MKVKEIATALVVGFTVAGMSRMLAMLVDNILQPYLVRFANWF